MHQSTGSEAIHVIAVVRDMMFSSRLREVAKQIGGTLSIARESSTIESCEAPHARVVVDLNLTNGDPFAAIAAAQARGYEVQCFFSHVDVELARRARALGVRQVMPRSQFVLHLEDLFTTPLSSSSGE